MRPLLLIVTIWFSSLFLQKSYAQEVDWTFEYDPCFIYFLFHESDEARISLKVAFTDSLTDKDPIFVTNRNRGNLFFLLKNQLPFDKTIITYEDSLETLYLFMDSVYRNNKVVLLPQEEFCRKRLWSVRHYIPINFLTKHQTVEHLIEKDDDPWYYEGYIDRLWLPELYVGVDEVMFYHWFFANHKLVTFVFGESAFCVSLGYKNRCDWDMYKNKF